MLRARKKVRTKEKSKERRSDGDPALASYFERQFRFEALVRGPGERTRAKFP